MTFGYEGLSLKEVLNKVTGGDASGEQTERYNTELALSASGEAWSYGSKEVSQ